VRFFTPMVTKASQLLQRSLQSAAESHTILTQRLDFTTLAPVGGHCYSLVSRKIEQFCPQNDIMGSS